jgi:hypothetical protein
MNHPPFKPQRRSRFVAELEQLARLIAFRPELRLTLGRPGSCWSFDATTGTISIDSGRLETESEDFTRGLVLHESAHATITRLHDIVPSHLLKQRSLFALLNATEDCRIETWLQNRYPGCRPWIREYNNILFRPLLDGNAGHPPAGQFLNGILTRWWYGQPAAGTSDEVREAVESVWPAMKQVLQALPPSPEALADVFSHYIRHPVFRCYTRRDADDPPTDYECAVRTVQYDMWAVVHRHILPVYARFLPPDERPCPELNHYLVLFSGAVPNRHLLGGRSVARIGSRTLAVLFPKARGDHQPLNPTGLDKYLDSCQRQHPAIESLAESLLRWFQAHGRIRIRRGCRCGPRLDLRAAMRFEADPRFYDQLWNRPLLPERIDPHFILLIDRSGSMEGERIEQVFHGTVLLSEVCGRVGVPLDLFAFNHHTERLLDHLEPLADPVRARLGALPKSASGGTNLGGALDAAAEAIQAAPGRDRFVLVLSDGLPNNVSSVRAGLARFTALGCHVFGLGLGPETFALRDLIPSSRVNLSATEVPAALANLLMECTRIRAMTL